MAIFIMVSVLLFLVSAVLRGGRVVSGRSNKESRVSRAVRAVREFVSGPEKTDKDVKSSPRHVPTGDGLLNRAVEGVKTRKQRLDDEIERSGG